MSRAVYAATVCIALKWQRTQQHCDHCHDRGGPLQAWVPTGSTAGAASAGRSDCLPESCGSCRSAITNVPCLDRTSGFCCFTIESCIHEEPSGNPSSMTRKISCIPHNIAPGWLSSLCLCGRHGKLPASSWRSAILLACHSRLYSNNQVRLTFSASRKTVDQQPARCTLLVLHDCKLECAPGGRTDQERCLEVLTVLLARCRPASGHGIHSNL